VPLSAARSLWVEHGGGSAGRERFIQGPGTARTIIELSVTGNPKTISTSHTYERDVIGAPLLPPRRVKTDQATQQ
jgi:hypothetical protein